MIGFLFLAASELVCPKTVMMNVTKYPWNAFDRKTLKGAQKRCEQLYPDAPCVKLFRKYDKQDYSVICGFKRKQQ